MVSEERSDKGSIDVAAGARRLAPSRRGEEEK